VEIHTADVKGQFRSQHLKKTQDVISGSVKRDPADRPMSHLGQDPCAGFVPFVEMERIARRPFAEEPFEPVGVFPVALRARTTRTRGGSKRSCSMWII
jgi:hypothetical protein